MNCQARWCSWCGVAAVFVGFFMLEASAQEAPEAPAEAAMALSREAARIDAAPQDAEAAFSAEELQALVAPVALYPDLVLVLALEAAAGEPASPVGPLLAAAVEAREVGDSYNGYRYRILTRQGANPPGRAYDYVINGNMIAGFALIAWPAMYDYSGIMTLMVNHQGRVYEKDLGLETAEVVAAIDAYDPDATWTEVTE